MTKKQETTYGDIDKFKKHVTDTILKGFQEEHEKARKNKMIIPDDEIRVRFNELSKQQEQPKKAEPTLQLKVIACRQCNNTAIILDTHDVIDHTGIVCTVCSSRANVICTSIGILAYTEKLECVGMFPMPECLTIK